MKRKVIQIAGSTQLISLPRKWAQSFNIKKGEELEISEQGNKLIVATELKPEKQEIEIDVTDLDRSSILHTVRSLYRRGFDSIRVNFKKPIAPHYRVGDTKKIISIIHEEVNRLSGVEIIQQKEDFCHITGLSTINQKEFDNVLRRVFILLTDESKDFLQAIEKNDKILLETIEEKHDSILKFINYCLRLLNKVGHPEQKNQAICYHIIATLYHITSQFKYAAREALVYARPFKKESCRIIALINSSLELYHDFFYKFDLTKVQELSQNKEKAKQLISELPSKNPLKETLILGRLSQVLEILLDMTDARMSLQY